MNLREVLQRLDYERRHVAPPATMRDMLPHLTRTSAPWHGIAWSSLNSDNADSAISFEVDHHRNLGARFEWKLYSHDAPGDMLMRLRRHGFEIGEREAVLIFDLADRPAWMNDTSHRVVRLESLEQLPVYNGVLEAVFEKHNDTTLADRTRAIEAGSSHQRGYVAYDGGQPVSIGRLYTQGDSWFAGLYGGGTLPTHRGRGHYRALVAARARDALAAGARYLQVDALPTSRPILERLGFQWLTDTWPCDWHP